MNFKHALLFIALSLPAAGKPVDVDALVRQMTVTEKFGQLQQYTGFGFATGPTQKAEAEKQIELIRAGRVGSILNTVGAGRTNALQKVAVEESRLKIPILFGFDVIHGHRTVFPDPLGESAGFDPGLCEETAAAAAREARSQGIRWTFAPMLDIARDARWGRVIEGSGEDPYLGAVLGAARVRGFQRGGRFAACAKHWVAYGAAEAGRDYNTVDVSERTLREIYFPPFKAAVEAGVMTFMTAFNEVSGTPSTANRFILTNVLRGEWGFRGFVVSDYEAVDELRHHGVAADGRQAGLLALTAGCDMEMVSEHMSNYGPELLKSGQLSIDVVDEAVRRVLRTKVELGLFDDPYTQERGEESALHNPAHRQLARRAAAACMVLLKNEGARLPLSTDLKRIVVVGPLGDNQADMLGPWHADGRKEEAVALLAGLRKRLPGAQIDYVQGCGFDAKSPLQKEAVRRAIGNADMVIVAVGESETMSGEANCRTRIDLPGDQTELVKTVHATGRPYVVTLIHGRPLALGWVADNAPAILECWFPGSEGGNAIADVLFGDVNPAGKLPISFPRNVGQCPIYYNHKNTGRPVGLRDSYVSNYLDVSNDPQYPFGYGLSYTTFSFGKGVLSATTVPAGGKVLVTARVTNTGDRAGDEVVQCYIRDTVSSVTRPVRELKAFQRIHLKPGQSQAVLFELGPEQLGFYDRNLKFVVEPGQFEVYLGNSSQAPLLGTFEQQ